MGKCNKINDFAVFEEALVTRDLTNCQNSTVKKMDNKNWSFCKHNDEFELYQVEYVIDHIRFTEKYLLKNKELIYAVEWEKRPANAKDEEATWWNCEYIIQDGHVVDHISLGMGKTEGETFDLQEITSLWDARKGGFEKMEKSLHN